jgi:hypothetical protein
MELEQNEMSHEPNNKDPQELAVQSAEMGEVRPWEQIEPGRFMPRRVRGSCRGLALG